MLLFQLAPALLGYLQRFPLFNANGGDSTQAPSPASLDPPVPQFPSWPIDLTALFDNIAVGPHANFDHWNGESWAPELMPRKSLVAHGIEYILPQKWDGRPDNVVSKDQEIMIPATIEYPREMHILYAGDFTDGTMPRFCATRLELADPFVQARLGLRSRSTSRMDPSSAWKVRVILHYITITFYPEPLSTRISLNP